MKKVVQWQELLARPDDGHHLVQVYQDDNFLAETVTYFVQSGLRQGDGLIVIATPEHWALFADRLAAEGCDVRDALYREQLNVLDAEGTLSTFMKDGTPDWESFLKVVGGLIERVQTRHPVIRTYGEMVNILWHRGQRAAAERLEDYWNILAERKPFSLLCAYYMDNLDPSVYRGPLECICSTHSHLIPDRDYVRFDAEVNRASQDVLGQPLANMMRSLAAASLPRTNMPFSQAILLYLNENMPVTADKILSETRSKRARL